jgi:hypothetical protein
MIRKMLISKLFDVLNITKLVYQNLLYMPRKQLNIMASTSRAPSKITRIETRLILMFEMLVINFQSPFQNNKD